MPAGPLTIDPAHLDELKEMFPGGKDQLDTIAALLAAPPTTERVPELLDALRAFSAATQTGFTDGEGDALDQGPGMLAPDQDPEKLLTTFADEAGLGRGGIRRRGGGERPARAILLARLWHGAARSCASSATGRWKNRAGVVGRKGAGPRHRSAAR